MDWRRVRVGGLRLALVFVLVAVPGMEFASPPGFSNMKCVGGTKKCGVYSAMCDVGSTTCTACDGTVNMNAACVHDSGSFCVSSSHTTCGAQFMGTCNPSGVCILGGSEIGDNCPVANCTAGSEEE